MKLREVVRIALPAAAASTRRPRGHAGPDYRDIFRGHGKRFLRLYSLFSLHPQALSEVLSLPYDFHIVR